MNQRRNTKSMLIILFSLLICIPLTFTTINIMALTNEVETNDSETTIELEKEYIPSEQISVFVDIKPGSWPNPINLKSKGVLPVAICGTEEFDVKTIDPASANIGAVYAIRWSYEDVATPYNGDLGGGHEFNGDGIIDLVLHFSTKEVIDTLGLSEYEGKAIPLVIEGNLYGENEEEDGTTIQGQDFVWILGKVLKPFSIDSSGGGDYTWEEASKQPWCKGEGTSENPYIIKNIAIDGEDSGSCLEIWNSDVHFIIEHSKFYNGKLGVAALLLVNVDNAMIIHNDVSNNYGSGIAIISSNEIKVVDNDCSENNLGIYILNSYNVEISKNFCEKNTWGIVLEGYSHDNTLYRNTCSKNSQYGILIYSNVEYNMLNENDCSENLGGIVLTIDADNNIISGNLCQKNTGSGIVLVNDVEYNLVIENLCSQNGGVGIYLNSSASWNEISYNTAIENTWGIGVDYDSYHNIKTCYNNEIHHNTIMSNYFVDRFDSGIGTLWHDNTPPP